MPTVAAPVFVSSLWDEAPFGHDISALPYWQRLTAQACVAEMERNRVHPSYTLQFLGGVARPNRWQTNTIVTYYSIYGGLLSGACYQSYWPPTGNDWPIWSVGRINLEPTAMREAPPVFHDLSALLHYPLDTPIDELPRSLDVVAHSSANVQLILHEVAASPNFEWDSNDEANTNFSFAPNEHACRAPDEGVVARVSSFANLRASPYLGRIVGRALIGEHYEVLSQRPAFHDHACDYICAGFTEWDLEARTQCINNNMVWQQIRTASGVEGFISRKFLR